MNLPAAQGSIRSLRDWLDNGDTQQLLDWASRLQPGKASPWFLLHNAWRACANKQALSWPLLKDCISATHAQEGWRSVNPLLALEAFSFRPVADPNRMNAWTYHLDPENAHALIEQAVVWRTERGHGDSYFDECLLSNLLMQLSIECQQGQIWKEHIHLYEYPLEPASALLHTELTRCVDPAVYSALEYYQSLSSTKTRWKKQCLQNGQWHNFTQLSATPFAVAEYIIDQHAQYDNSSSYKELVAASQFELFSQVTPTDTWMLAQLSSPGGDWHRTNCPEPRNTQLQAWWYSLLLGVDDVALLHALLPENAPTEHGALPLPEQFILP